MTRVIYAVLWAVALPLALARLAWRARGQPGYLAHLGERLGRYGARAPAPYLWVHAVSVGETRAAAPLIEALLARHPGHRILLTHMTPTGRATGESLFGQRVEQAWLPYDVGFAVRSFLAHFRPEVGIVMETEVWPRIIEACARRGIPTVLANARLSERSASRYARWPSLAAWAFGHISVVAAQGEPDAQRFRRLGARRIEITGNVKFDVAVPEAMRVLGAEFRAALAGGSHVIVAGSTREGEEALLLEALAQGAAAGMRLVIVPRHPQRFDAVAALAAERGFTVARRSAGMEQAGDARVVVGDSMGEMLAYYAAADVVIMGGSLLAFGSQNLIEPCALGVPVVVGPHTYNFEDASRGAIAAGAATRAENAADALAKAAAIATDRERQRAMGRAGEAFVAAHRGVVDRLVALVDSALAEASGRAPG